MVFRKILEIFYPSCITIPKKSKTYSGAKIVVKMFNIVVKSQLLHVQNLKVRKFYKSFGVPIKMIFFTPLFIIIPSPSHLSWS